MVVGGAENLDELVEANMAVGVGIGRGEDGLDDRVQARLGVGASGRKEPQARQDGAQLRGVYLTVAVRVKEVKGAAECGGGGHIQWRCTGAKLAKVDAPVGVGVECLEHLLGVGIARAERSHCRRQLRLVDEAVAVGVKSAEHRRHFLEGGAGKELLPARRIGMRCRPRWQCGSTGANGGGGVRRADNEGHGAGGGTPDSPSSVEPLQVFVRAGKGLGRSGSSRHPRQRQDLGRGDAGSRVFLEHAVDELAGRAGRPGPLAGVATPVSAEGGLAGSDAQPLLSGRGRADGIERQVAAEECEEADA
mmetsp:Transcript_16587/g.54077  ORF Transcript_16587/g.54077 Transcript_16587/m.54077 type:complete len:305 (-) Transcript_16587:266-1180(-)